MTAAEGSAESSSTLTGWTGTVLGRVRTGEDADECRLVFAAYLDPSDRASLDSAGVTYRCRAEGSAPAPGQVTSGTLTIADADFLAVFSVEAASTSDGGGIALHVVGLEEYVERLPAE